ncbi:MAG: HAD hydrolase family protein [Bacteroidales bacterium]|nr:HAD hydrolase family protein [Bacteroidales bacterium]
MTELKDIKAFAFDVDGIFTDGSVLAMPDGDLLRTFNAKDSFAVRMAWMNGFPVGIITGGCSESILNRFKMLGVETENIYMLSRNKIVDLEHFCKRNNLTLDQVAFAGDDVPDIPALKAAGLGICPADAVEEVKQASDIVSEEPGGKRFVRDLIERTLRAQGKWKFDPHGSWACLYPDHLAAFADKTGKNV